MTMPVFKNKYAVGDASVKILVTIWKLEGNLMIDAFDTLTLGTECEERSFSTFLQPDEAVRFRDELIRLFPLEDK